MRRAGRAIHSPRRLPLTSRYSNSRPGRRWLLIGLAVVAVLAIGGGAYGFSYLFLRPPAPAVVGLATTAPSATSATTEEPSNPPDPSASSSDSSAATGDSLDGTWSVDPAIGSFSDFSGSFAGYRVEEELANIGAATAVGRTPDVTGNLKLDGTTLSAADFTADLSTLRSDDDRRDGQLRQQALETSAYPTATFKLTEPIALDSVPADGQVVSVTATGDLTLHGQTNSVEIPLAARLSGDVVTVTGSLEVTFADYGIAKPNSFMVLSIADHGTMEVQLQFTKG
jgi:polyisoprenoid-binding protein YceI